MSEKITFRELIESIAEETDNSKQFTHDFLKDFVDVINDGLEQDRKVSIAGFGKFKLRRMGEREGYNPQSGEKITIPEHNKIVFKPYKDLRELVNAPYAHLEPELVEESTSSDEGATSENAEQNVSESGDENAGDQSSEDDFIPTAPPTAHQPEEEETETEITSESEEEAPFDFADDQDEVGDEEEESSSPYLSEEESRDEEDDNENIDRDIVEFDGHSDHTTEEEQPEDDLSEFMGASDQPAEEKKSGFEKEEELNEETQEESEEESVQTSFGGEDLDPFAEGFEEKDEESSTPVPSSPSDKRSGKKVSAMPVIAAAVALLFIAAGAWYFTGSTSSTDTPEMVIEEPTSSAVDQKDNQEESASQEAEASETENQNQSQETTTASSNASQESDNNTELEIDEGQTLWSIAEEKYGNPRLWPWIYGKNGSLKNPDLILAGKSLSVPLPSGPQNTLNDSDSVGVAKGYIATYNWYKSSDSVKAKNHLWAAKSYHDNVRDISDIQIDKADLTYVNQSR